MLAAALPLTFAGIGVLEAAIESSIAGSFCAYSGIGLSCCTGFRDRSASDRRDRDHFYWTANDEVRTSLEESGQHQDPTDSASAAAE